MGIQNKTYAKNRKAYHDYEMLESLEAGISLTGPEVKSVRNSQINLLGSFVFIEGGVIQLKQCHISRPDHLSYCAKSFEEERSRNLLLHKSEIQKLRKMVQEKGITLIVSEVYQRDGTSTIKCKLNIAKGKREFDKRETIKRKQADVDAKRAMKDY